MVLIKKFLIPQKKFTLKSMISLNHTNLELYKKYMYSYPGTSMHW